MCDDDSQCRITRVVDGDDHDVQLAQLQVVMQRIQTALCNIPAAERIYLGNALLNLAVRKILCAEGSQQTTGMLLRLSNAMHEHATSTEASSHTTPGAQYG